VTDAIYNKVKAVKNVPDFPSVTRYVAAGSRPQNRLKFNEIAKTCCNAANFRYSSKQYGCSWTVLPGMTEQTN
jgi:hypothetical protein